jgi:hypothetical protein
VDDEDVELQCQMLQLLLNKKLTTFHFPRGLSSENQAAATELGQGLLAQRPPDLQSVVRKCHENVVIPWDLDPFFDSMLPLFPKLQTLQLERFTCNDSHLGSIAAPLPKLRCVYSFIGFC